MDLKGTVTARPIRVAYVVQDDEHSEYLLDAIFAEGHSRWGGRYSLIVPAANSELDPAYLTMLQAYDADIIYSYVDLSDAEVRRVHELLGPSHLIRHQHYGTGKEPKDARYFTPKLPLECLSSLSVAPAYARGFPISAPQPIHLVDYAPGQARDRFIDDNFGSYYESFHRWPIPAPLGDALQPIHVIAADKRKDSVERFGRAQTVVTDVPELLDFMAKNRNSFGLAQLSADAAPRLDIPQFGGDSLSLVIGSRFSDRLMFWNHRFFAPGYLGRDVVTLIVDQARLDEERFFKSLVNFLKHRNGVMNSNGTPWVTLRSTSLSREELSLIQQKLQRADAWNGYHLEPEKHPWPIVAADKDVHEYVGLVVGGNFGRGKSSKEFVLQQTTTIPQQLPNHLNHLPMTAATIGAWALDIHLARKGWHGPGAWLLPRRLRMHGAFGTTNSMDPPRSNRGGELTAFTSMNKQPVEITLPSNELAFRHAIERGEDWLPFAESSEDYRPKGPYPWSRSSDKGRYFLGAERLFGSLDQMAGVLLHKYWNEVFEKLGASIGNERLADIKNTLRKRFRNTQKIETDEDFDRLAGIVAGFSHRVRNPSLSIDLQKLKQRHAPFLENEKRTLEELKTEEPEQWLQHASESLFTSIQNMALNGVLLQGYEWQCRECFHTNWNGIANLGPELTCEACGRSTAAPTEKPWDFKLHGFVLAALKEHGLLPVVWAVTELGKHTFGGFYFLPPHEFLSGYPGEKDTERLGEADLLCVIKTEVVLVEAKSSSQGIDLTNLIATARRLRPNKVVLAIMEPTSAKAKAKLEELKAGLAGTDIACSLLTTSMSTFDNDANLP